MLSYHFTKFVDQSFDKAVEKVIVELKNQGFGIVTEINMKELLKNKINVDFRRYIILGACNPQFAYLALVMEDKVGTLLPCNVIVQEHENGKVEVSIVDPHSYILTFHNENLEKLIAQIREKLENVMDKL